jgi:hypothetical protein
MSYSFSLAIVYGWVTLFIAYNGSLLAFRLGIRSQLIDRRKRMACDSGNCPCSDFNLRFKVVAFMECGDV